MVSGLPRVATINSDDVTDAIQHELQGMIEAIKDVLHDTPPELSADVMEKGMVISGGSAQLRNLDKLFSEATGVPAFMASEPQLCVAKGTGIALENLESYKRSIFSS
jgi:rod shape-determining protein MreB